MPQPFEVDVAADVWTILTTFAGIGAAAGAVWAVLVALHTQRRQVEIERAQHASRVTIYANRGAARAVVENLGDLPVYSVTLTAAASNGRPKLLDTKARLGRQESLEGRLDQAVEPSEKRLWVVFTDSNGVRWVRYVDGTLKEKKKAGAQAGP
jgi:hypothetical protein